MRKVRFAFCLLLICGLAAAFPARRADIVSAVDLAAAMPSATPPDEPEAVTSPDPERPDGTVSFSNTAAISIPAFGNAGLYPSPIAVSGVGASASKVTVTLSGFSHSFPDDVDVLLVGPTGARAVLLSDAGGIGPGVSNLNFTFDQTAATLISDGTAPTSGTYQPVNYTSVDAFDTWPAPGPGTLTAEPANQSGDR